MLLSARSFVRRLAWLLPALALAPTPSSAQTATTEQVTAALAQLEQLAEAAISDGSVPALAIGVVHDDKVVFLKGFGLREAGKPEKVDADTVFQIASMSKPISATVVAALVGDGTVSWDAKISDLDPAFHFNSMRSGLLHDLHRRFQRKFAVALIASKRKIHYDQSFRYCPDNR